MNKIFQELAKKVSDHHEGIADDNQSDVQADQQHVSDALSHCPNCGHELPSSSPDDDARAKAAAAIAGGFDRMGAGGSGATE